ncbi:MAG TPA: fumarylacetoacetate hydrolase family protein, partial [Polyangiales bacterium]|nr:fumarylacetoacetate hydrolase family protein [Polyangiales bacterium]
MRLASVADGSRDGALVIVDASGRRAASARAIAPCLQAALDHWERCEPRLRELSSDVEQGRVPTEEIDPQRWLAPLPRAYEWVDGSAYVNHVVLVRKARGAEPPETLYSDPLVYQGGSGVMLPPRAALELADPAHGLDFEAEIAVVLGDVPLGTTAGEAERHVRLFMLCNDVTLRNLVPAELAKSFGFFCSKPASAFAPFAVTPDELGGAWRDGRVQLRVCSYLNDALAGDPDAGTGMHFSFLELIAHIAQTRAFTAGTILGSGTVSNEDPERGVSCLAERRAREMIASGSASTPFLRAG